MLRPYIEELSRIAPVYLSCYPNAGLPNAFGGFDETPEMMAATLGEFAANGWLNIVGGCCGTTPPHIRAICRGRGRQTAAPPGHSPNRSRGSAASKLLTIRPESNFLMIGERTNITGSKKFSKLILAGKFEEGIAVAREQVEAGANVIDINMDEGMLDGEAAMTRFLNLVAAEPEVARVPIMVDSSKWSVIEAGLKCVQGKGIVNSISLKEGEEAFLRQARLVRRYGAAAVVMAFDEQGQAVTVEDKVRICRRAYRLLTEQVGMAPTDVIFDPNILTVATGMEEHNRYAINFIEATRLIKQECPGAKISGGVSNISFSFRGNDVVREAMHSAFLYHAIRAGTGHGNRQRRATRRLRADSQAAARTGRGRALRSPARCDRAVDRIRRVGQTAGRQGARGGVGLAGRKRRRAAEPCLGPRDRRIHRPRRRGSPRQISQRPGDHRRAADGRDASGRRSVRRGEDVFAAGCRKALA